MELSALLESEFCFLCVSAAKSMMKKANRKYEKGRTASG